MSLYKITLNGVQIDTMEQLRTNFGADLLRSFKMQEIHDWFASRKLYDEMNTCWGIDQSMGDAQVLVQLGQLIGVDCSIEYANRILNIGQKPKEDLTKEYKPITQKQQVQEFLASKEEAPNIVSNNSPINYNYAKPIQLSPQSQTIQQQTVVQQSSPQPQVQQQFIQQPTPISGPTRVVTSSKLEDPILVTPQLTTIPQFLSEDEIFQIQGVKLASVSTQSNHEVLKKPTMKKPVTPELIVTMPKVDENLLVLAVFVKKNQKVRKRDKIIEFYYNDKYYYILSPADGVVHDLYFTPQAIDRMRSTMAYIDLTFRPILTLRVEKVSSVIRNIAVQGIAKLTYQF